jgi:uncharacterized protein HemY
MLGDLEVRVGNRPAAIVQYRAVLDKDRNNVLGLNNLAYLLANVNPDEALTHAQKAVEAQPGNPAVLDTLGWVCYRKGLYQMAVEHLKNAVAKGDTPERKYHLALAYLKVGKRAQGEKLLQAALTADPMLPKKEPW